jgi:hypothetical protein
MPATEAIGGMGTALRRNGVEIAEVFDIGGPEFTAEVIDATHLKSPDFWREKIGNLKDGGELTFSVNLILANATHNAATGLLSTLAGSSAPPRDTWDLIFPDVAATTWTLYGPLTGYKTGATIDDKLQAEITVTISGAPVLA